MKRHTLRDPRVPHLAEVLGLEWWGAVGILEALFHVTAEALPRGNIGAWSDRRIARELSWGGDPDRLVGGLVAAGWLTRDPARRLVVRDWPDLASQAVRRRIARLGPPG